MITIEEEDAREQNPTYTTMTKNNTTNSGFQFPMAAKDSPFVGPFDPAAHDVSAFDFSFTPRTHRTLQKTHRDRLAKKARKARGIATRARMHKKMMSAQCFAAHNTASRMAAFKIYQQRARFAVVGSPRKRRHFTEETSEDSAEFDPHFELAVEETLFTVSWAKADVRNYLRTLQSESYGTDASKPWQRPVGATTTKRKADGTSRGWIRSRQIHPDVAYLLTFPGPRMTAYKAHDLLERRDLIPLDPITETENTSLVLPTEVPSTATHISEANRQAKLNAVKCQLQPDTQDEPADVTMQDVEQTPEASSSPVPAEPSTPPGVQATVVEPTPIQESDQVRVFQVPSFVSDTTYLQASEQPCTPPARTTPAQHVLDVDLNEHPDIFASALLQNRNTHLPPVTSSPQPKFTTTPQVSSPCPSIGSADNDTNFYGCWSPLASTPSATIASQSHLNPDTSAPVVDPETQENQDQDTAIVAMPETPTTLSQPTPTVADTRVTVSKDDGRFIVRFRLPEQCANRFLRREPQPRQDSEFTTEQAEQKKEESEPDREVQQENQTVKDEEAEADVTDDDPRDLLRQFVTKHQAGKAKATPDVAVASTPVTSGTPITNGATTTAPPPSPSITIQLTTTPEGPKTPEVGQRDRSRQMWMETPDFTLESQPSGTKSPAQKTESPSRPRARIPLGQIDGNSPSPVKSVSTKRKLDDDHGPSSGQQDEQTEEKETLPSPKRRRNLRARKPLAEPAPRNPRLVRNAGKDLASLTRANTRANKGNALFPSEVLAKHAEDPLGYQWKERKAVVDAKAARVPKAGAKSVHWPDVLAEYFERPASTSSDDDELQGQPEEKENQEQEEPAAAVPDPVVATPIKKKSGLLPKNGTPRSKLPAPVTRTRRAAAAAAAAAASAKGEKDKETTTRVTAPRAAKIVKTQQQRPVRAKKTAPSTQSEAATEEEERPVRARRAAAQQSNLRMGLTATGTPRRRSARTAK